MPSSDPKKTLSPAQCEALLALGSEGPGAAIDLQALSSLVSAGMVEVNKSRQVVLTARGEMAFAYLNASK